MSSQGAELWRQLRQPDDAKSGMCMAVQLFSEPAVEGDQQRMQKHVEVRNLHAAVGYEDGSVAVWDTAQPHAPVMSMRLHSEPVMALAIDSAGTGLDGLALVTVQTIGVSHSCVQASSVVIATQACMQEF